jgi:predicted transcriptional regulator
MESISDQLKEMEDIEQGINEEVLEKQEIFKSRRLFKCILGLNQLETNIFAYLLKNDNVGTAELTNKLEMDRSSIQRALQSLNEINLITRTSMSLKKYSEKKKLTKGKKRGYLYVYNAKDIDFIKKQLHDLLDKWYESMKDYIDDADSLFDCYMINGELC